ncbi:MAG: exported protein of unknown function [Candidatus Saccharibacteria bacterium]|nr:exported protein of unknown function [Candidatus Saccharibacteria bacterium]
MIAGIRHIIVRHLSYGNNITRNLKLLGLGVLLVLFSGIFSYTRADIYNTRVYAAAATNLNFQARLQSNTGAVVADGNYSIEFKLYSAGTGGTAQWTETQSTIAVKGGYLSVHLGSVSAFPSTIDWSQEQWLTMNVNADGEMNPRLKLTAVPFAFRAGQADGITNGATKLTADELLQKAPLDLQALASSVAGLRFDQTGSGGLIQLRGDGNDAFTVSKAGGGYFRGSLDIDGSVLDVGAAATSGALVLHDSSGYSGTFQTTTLAGNRTYTFPDASGTVCLTTTCPGAANGFGQDGNSFSGLATLGTNDNNALAFETFGTTKMTILASGNVGIGEANPGALFSVGSGSAFQIDNSGNITAIGSTVTRNGSLTFDLGNASATALTLTNTGAGTASLNIAEGGLQLAGTSRITNSGGLENITGYTQSSGDFAMSGSGTFGTGTGSVSLNGNTTVASGKTLAVLGATSITPSGANEVAMTINGTSGTAATALNVVQTGDAANIVMSNSARTSGALVSLTQSNSAFTGTGLVLNFASGSGSFASGNFLDFQVNGASKFRVDNTGALEMKSDSAAALVVKDATGNTSFFTVNTTGNIVQVGSATGDSTAMLFILDSKNTAGDPTGVNGASYYNASNNKFRCYEGGNWKNCITASSVFKSADQVVTNNATFQSDSDLSFNMEANATYTFDGIINFNATSAVAGYKLTFTVPSGASMSIAAYNPTSGTAMSTCNMSTSGETCTVTITAGIRGNIRISGYVANGANSGNTQFQFAQNTAVAAQSVTVYKGSSINYQRTDP